MKHLRVLLLGAVILFAVGGSCDCASRYLFSAFRLDAPQPLTGPQYLLASSNHGVDLLRADAPDGTWTQINPVNAGSMIDLSVDPFQADALYVISAAGGNESFVHRSVDRGATWTRLTGGGLPAAVDPDRQVFVIRADPRVVDRVWLAYTKRVGATGDVLFRSDDAGQTWVASGAGLGPAVDRIEFDAVDPDLLYVRAHDGNNVQEVHRSSDGGLTWTLFQAGLPTTNNPANVIAPDASLTGRVYALTYDSVYVSDAGAAWTEVTGARSLLTSFNTNGYVPQPWSLTVDPTDPDLLYLGISVEGLYRSTDGGATWSVRSGTGIGGGDNLIERTPLQVLIDAATPTRLLVLTTDTILLSTDGGATWREQSTDGIPRFKSGCGL